MRGKKGILFGMEKAMHGQYPLWSQRLMKTEESHNTWNCSRKLFYFHDGSHKRMSQAKNVCFHLWLISSLPLSWGQGWPSRFVDFDKQGFSLKAECGAPIYLAAEVARVLNNRWISKPLGFLAARNAGSSTCIRFILPTKECQVSLTLTIVRIRNKFMKKTRITCNRAHLSLTGLTGLTVLVGRNWRIRRNVTMAGRTDDKDRANGSWKAGMSNQGFTSVWK